MRDPLKFLVVDPLAGVQAFARQLLQGHGFAADRILCCADSDTALAQGLVFKPQFLITDWFAKAPLTGLQLFQRLREVQPALQLSLLSFDVTPERQLEAEAHGAHFLLKKPFTAEQLKAEVSRSLDALARSAPGLHSQVRDVVRSARPTPRAQLPVMPPLPLIKPGDKVHFNGAVHVAQYVVHRSGETVVQLKGQNSFVPLEKLQPA
ncbi:response regulator [Pelomonas cellulosilytica]|uniref:Response regulator n=1 Tax=Pelomonas cellulosilytica TaxID=2906762 RepID=A0ABS8XTB8_9BURK|nr:response regulator [Pelomonas sp. P8]MCE4554142.1 response regulator [Pelomonas sp. P8]